MYTCVYVRVYLQTDCLHEWITCINVSLVDVDIILICKIKHSIDFTSTIIYRHKIIPTTTKTHTPPKKNQQNKPADTYKLESRYLTVI